jgi:protoporphyrinogen oxidase
MTQADVLIVGAGAAGLMAAKEIAAVGKSVIVLEGRNRIGGRVHTETGNGFSEPVETGAEFVHGNLELTRSLLNEANLHTIESGGILSCGRRSPAAGRSYGTQRQAIECIKPANNRKQHQGFLESHFPDAEHEELKKSIRGYVEGYYAGELANASVLAFKEEWQQERTAAVPRAGRLLPP